MKNIPKLITISNGSLRGKSIVELKFSFWKEIVKKLHERKLDSRKKYYGIQFTLEKRNNNDNI